MTTLTRTGPPLRTLALRTPLSPSRTTSKTSRLYHSYEVPPTPPYPEPQRSILAAALSHVPTTGFTQTSLRQGLQDAGYRDASANLFPRGEFEIVMWHLRNQRTGLGERVQFSEGGKEEAARKMGTTGKVRALVLERLRGNVESGVLGRLQEALALMSLAGNIPPSLKELFLLSDEIWFLAGDEAVDTSWYTKRATLSSIYAATEIYQTTDQSTEFKDTAEFLDRRLDEARVLGSSWRNVKEWAGFQAIAGVNLARSLGMRI